MEYHFKIGEYHSYNSAEHVAGLKEAIGINPSRERVV